MPIMKCAASKATPQKGLAYILDPEKTLAMGSQGLRSDNPEEMAQQMIQTMHLHGQGWTEKERKYYHPKVSFALQDLPENGGSLTADVANEYARQMAEHLWPGREVAWSVQQHGEPMHIHFIVGACDPATGEKIDARNSEYAGWKDFSQVLAKEMGLTPMDWRKATRAKRQREAQDENPTKETFAEQGMKVRGAASWKDELRTKIDGAVQVSTSMGEFRAALQQRGVELTRCTAQTISYRLEGRERGCRGDTLGGDYTMAAIQSALQHNAQGLTPEPDPGRKLGLDAMMQSAARKAGAQATGGRVIDQKERQKLRELGRVAGFKRADIDSMCDHAEKATYAEKQEVWAGYKAAQDSFWDEYNIRQQALREDAGQIYQRLRKVREVEWMIDARNRRKSLGSVIYAGFFLMQDRNSRVELENQLYQLKLQQEQLREKAGKFKAARGEALEKLREEDLTVDEYIAALKRMQRMAGHAREANEHLSEQEKAFLRRQALIEQYRWSKAHPKSRGR